MSLKGGIGRGGEMAEPPAVFFLLILTDAMDFFAAHRPRIQTIFLGLIVVFAVAAEEIAKRRTSVD